MLSADGFSLCPFMFNGVKIRRIGRKIFQNMSGLKDGILSIPALMKRGIVHNEHRRFQDRRQQTFHHPSMENFTVYIKQTQADGRQHPFDKSTNNVGSSLSLPVLSAITTFSTGRITTDPGHIMGKPTFIQINDLSTFSLPYFHPAAESATLSGVCSGMLQSFFYRSCRNDAERNRLYFAVHPDAEPAHTGKHQGNSEYPEPVGQHQPF